MIDKHRKSLLARTKEFLKHFPASGGSPPDEIVETSFHCAYQDEILLHGTLYITQYRFCFKSRVLGRRKAIAVPWNEVLGVRKAKIAYVFPTAIQLETCDGCSYIFASFLQRETAYRKLITCHIDYRRSIPYPPNKENDDSKTASTGPAPPLLPTATPASRPGMPSSRQQPSSPARSRALWSWLSLVFNWCHSSNIEQAGGQPFLLTVISVAFLLHFFMMYKGIKDLEDRLLGMAGNQSSPSLGSILSTGVTS